MNLLPEILLQNLVKKKKKSTCKKSMIKHVQQDSVANLISFLYKTGIMNSDTLILKVQFR